jgi:hypothetical protein
MWGVSSKTHGFVVLIHSIQQWTWQAKGRSIIIEDIIEEPTKLSKTILLRIACPLRKKVIILYGSMNTLLHDLTLL